LFLQTLSVLMAILSATPCSSSPKPHARSSKEALLLLGLSDASDVTWRSHLIIAASHPVYLISLILHICIRLMTACSTLAAKKLEKASVCSTTRKAQVVNFSSAAVR
jgi:hypothetical protein